MTSKTVVLMSSPDASKPALRLQDHTIVSQITEASVSPKILASVGESAAAMYTVEEPSISKTAVDEAAEVPMLSILQLTSQTAHVWDKRMRLSKTLQSLNSQA